jgi:dihydroneopterin aldolase
LIETLASELAAKFLQTFPIDKVRLELRKFVLPDANHAAVIVTRSAQT